MSVRLVVKQRSAEGGAKTGTEQVMDAPVITMGRDKACEVVLQEQAVSRKHARISRDGELWFIEDLGSSYGTQVNGKKLGKGEKRLLRNGDVIAIAQFDVTFDRMQELMPSSEKTSFIARQAVKDVMKGLNAEKPFLRVMNTKMEGQRLEINEGQPVVIGRDPSCDMVLSDDMASRQHARVRRDFSGTHIEDLGSRNGIKVNKKRVKSRTLKDRDEVEVGGTRFLFLDPTEVREAPALEPEPAFEMTSPPQAKEPEPEPEPPPEPEPEPPPPEPEPEPPPAEEPPAEEPPPEEAPAGAGGGSKVPAFVGIGVMAVLGLAIIGFIVALLVGA
ncbi:MAG TPA: FHA domain-containing protein [Myxococcaceae bacterium]|jgi:pSer/pThr/pTyr-binding forkhead associated (FHA) protein